MKIFSLVLNSVEFDSRVRKTAATLSAYGDVTVFGLRDTPGQSVQIAGTDYQIVRSIAYAKGNTRGLRKRLAQTSAYLRYLCVVGFAARKGEVVVCNDLTALPVGLLAKLFRPSLKLVYDSHEYQAHTRWVGPRKRRVIQALERFALRFTAANVVVSPSIARAYVQDYGIAPPHVVMNCPPRRDAMPTGKLRTKIASSPDSRLVLFQGGLTQGRGIEQLLEAFSLVPHPNVHLVFMGYGPLEIRIQAARQSDSRISLVPAVPPEEVLDHTADADFGLSFLIDDCINHRYALPNKVFEYLMAGVPVLVNDLVEVRQIIEEYSAGLVVPEISVPALARVLNALPDYDRADFLANLPELRSRYSWEEQAKVWEVIMADLGLERRK